MIWEMGCTTGPSSSCVYQQFGSLGLDDDVNKLEEHRSRDLHVRAEVEQNDHQTILLNRPRISTRGRPLAHCTNINLIFLLQGFAIGIEGHLI